MENENYLIDVFIFGAVLFSWLWIFIAMNRILKASFGKISKRLEAVGIF